MSDQTTAPKVDDTNPAPAAETSSAAPETVPSEEASKLGAEQQDANMDTTRQADASSAQVKLEDAGDKSASTTTNNNTTSNNDTSSSEKKDETAAVAASAAATSVSGDKVEEMMTERIDTSEAEVNKSVDDGSAEVKMETSTSEDKPLEGEKVTSGDVTNASETTTTTTSQPQTTPAPPPPSSLATPVTDSKEPASEVKTPQPPTAAATAAPVMNEQPQQPKQPQSTLPTRQYLDATVVPILHSALSQLAKVRPEDPIHFLGTYLLEYKDSFNSEQK